jgi:hypothetical protein
MVGVRGFHIGGLLPQNGVLACLIEGKRTEPISDSTDWFPGRNQIIRNLEVAQALVDSRKNFAVLVCTETPPIDLSW